jgi:hypothetical protein
VLEVKRMLREIQLCGKKRERREEILLLQKLLRELNS